MPTVLAAEESGGGSFLVSPDVGLMIWTLVVFVISMYILSKVAFPRIAEALDKRQQAIEESIDTAERTRTEAQRLLEEYRERLARGARAGRRRSSRGRARRPRTTRPRRSRRPSASARR